MAGGNVGIPPDFKGHRPTRPGGPQWLCLLREYANSSGALQMAQPVGIPCAVQETQEM